MATEKQKKIFAQNFNHMLEAKHMNRAELSRALNYPETTLANWANGVNYPRIDKIQELADFFGVNKSDLIEDKHAMPDASDSPAAPEMHRYVRINVYGTIPAGIPIEAIEDIIDWEDIPEEWCRGGKEFFALQVKGDSMIPDYIEGDTIICEVTPDFFDGDDCVVYVNGYDATLKRCFHKGADILLEPVNSQYAPRLYRIAEDIEPYATNVLSARVLGVVRELRRKPNRYR